MVLIFAAAAIILLVLCTTLATVRYPTAVQQRVTVATDGQNYQPGDEVFVTVQVSLGGVNADAIWVFVQEPTDQNNYFEQLPPTGGTTNFTLAMNAPAGNYTVFAAWNYPAGDYVTTWFAVTNLSVPEFPSSMLVFLVALAALIGAMAWRKTPLSATTRGPPSSLPYLR